MRVTLFCLLALPFSGLAQENKPAQKYEHAPFNLRIAPLALINPFRQSVSLQADIPLSARWVIDMGAGFIFNSGGSANQQGESYWGVRVKPAIKYYYRQPTRRGARPTLSLALKYQHIYNDRYVNTLRQGGQYVEWFLNRRHHVSWGAIVQYARINYFGKNDRWLIEPFFGLGPRWIKISNDPLPPDAELLTEEMLFNPQREPGTYYVPDFLLGVNIGYVLSKK